MVTQLFGWFRAQSISAQRVSYVSYVTEPNAAKLANCWSSQERSQNGPLFYHFFASFLSLLKFLESQNWKCAKIDPFLNHFFCFLSVIIEVLAVPKLAERDGQDLHPFFQPPPRKGAPFRGQINRV